MTMATRHDTIGQGAPQKETQFCTTVTARRLPEDDVSARAPVDIVVALDVSSSMSGRKIEMCKKTLSLLLRELGSQDRFGLVTFGDQATLEVPTRTLTKVNKETALAKIKGIRAYGSTNMSGGIGQAAQELQALESPHEVRTVFLLTDGHANVGISDKTAIVDLTKGCLGGTEGRRPVAVHCFGYGADHDREMLDGISTATEGGTYYFVGQDSDVSSAFGDALGGVLSVVAQNAVVNIQVAPNASELGVSIVNVKHPKAAKQVDRSYAISLGDFYAEESRDIVIEASLAQRCLKPGTFNTGDGVPHIIASLSYVDTIKKQIVARDSVVGSIVRPDGNEVSNTNSHVALQCIRIKTTEVISETETLAEKGELGKARSHIEQYAIRLQNEATTLGQSGNSLILQLLSELNKILSGLSSRVQYETTGCNYMHTRVNTHVSQRCADAECDALSSYRSPKKETLSRRLKSRSMM
eukprot:CAMPEP_0197247104 /NCGR_PEP_ID=MMETSP1429-20130617/26099_1 /TAXON_ID=49237 /ORGANISM="Chaetoceros  sp., Strain UNC1202" /LENGTH=468 /DNA_ID=CAMNT_0042707933 /DNA_START=167 /DNA_END=1573 /DNA_ORIENTATION=-